jgi:hypothetical protein
LEGNANTKAGPRAYICVLKRQVFLKLQKIVKSFAKLLDGYFKVFLPKIKDANSIWQTVGDA